MDDKIETLANVVKTQLMHRMETVTEFNERIARGENLSDGEIEQLLLESALIDAHALVDLVNIVEDLGRQVSELRRRLGE